MYFDVTIDKRFEILCGIIGSLVKAKPELKHNFYWIETPDTKYTHELTKQINIERYPRLIDFLLDIDDIGSYSELFLYFDETMTPLNVNKKINAFSNLTVDEFMLLVKELYDKEKLEKVFFENNNEINSLISLTDNILPDDFDINDFYFFCSDTNIERKLILSPQFNGGLGISKDNEHFFIRGVKMKNKSFSINSVGFITMLFHEFSHPVVNPLIDKYYDKFDNSSFLLEEAIENDLPHPYYNKKILLYEYFVRANELTLSSKYISLEDLEEKFERYEKTGFKYIRELTKLLKEKRECYNTYEEFIQNEGILFFNNISTKKREVFKTKI